jgi:hypothetical protein
MKICIKSLKSLKTSFKSEPGSSYKQTTLPHTLSTNPVSPLTTTQSLGSTRSEDSRPTRTGEPCRDSITAPRATFNSHRSTWWTRSWLSKSRFLRKTRLTTRLYKLRGCTWIRNSRRSGWRKRRRLISCCRLHSICRLRPEIKGLARMGRLISHLEGIRSSKMTSRTFRTVFITQWASTHLWATKPSGRR